ncbi:uncharacterized protein LOC122303096 [Carya illinoinensis]|uniref:uncharacterized protein LOC122303096 n=1 Tax=Carya illinoinensis TaxID=32201 RepID=UPI001C719668|nr:uncharacterized protein LOC122303096 [Carya illinoinensis]
MPHIEPPDLSLLLGVEMSTDQNSDLCLLPSEEEVKDAVFSIPQQSSPGPDGFGSSFYISCWQIVNEEVVEAARDFFAGSTLPRFYTSSYIVLILKVPDPKSFEKFPPISLCSVAYKIFSKILVTRLTGFLPMLISAEQGAFILGRSIFENISLAQEMVHVLKRKTVGGNVMVKLDMAKAYDRFGKGVHRIPLVLVDNEWVIQRVFQVDERLATRGSLDAIFIYIDARSTFEASSERIQRGPHCREKLAIFISPAISAARQCGLERLMGYAQASFSVMYLGVLLLSGRLKAIHMDQLLAKFQAKVAGWKARGGEPGLEEFSGNPMSNAFEIGVADFIDGLVMGSVHGGKVWKGPTCFSAISRPALKIKEVWVGDSWDVDMLQQLVAAELADVVISEVGVARSRQDVLI